ncbi:diguanylate cyclase (GGDEF) domain-containing protein [Blastococcus aurantiacus]|uniref:Diguanylate cyclase (GGDEF) domain-containing protein n=1 Tax=Blastococcus aurantiacus TaxID=1550231 RepID=A0A1G7RBU0_9ACTN|nr:GGDEF domain-containing protein [Blastococcus aurantiacus]SDG08105.1 diguanylate cyclase (GGDEF) domain-containing protein [Blastococcus aurantiacus]
MGRSTEQQGARDLASPRALAHTLGLFFVAGGCAAMVAASGGSDHLARRWAVAAAGVLAVTVGGAVFRWGSGTPRVVLGGLVTLGCALIGLVTLISPDPMTAAVCGSISAFVGVIACFFADRRVALVHVLTAVGATSAALLLRGDAPVATPAALAVVVVTLAAVTRTLVLRASDAGSDALTGPANRRGFDEALDEHLRRPELRVSAALLDLDLFKQVNDTAGHEAGDRLLRRVADSWRQALPSGAVLARHGGDEFALLAPGLSGPEALVVVRDLCALVPDVSVSAGVAERLAGDTAAQLMRRADLALYGVKADGRGAAALHAETVGA